MIKEATQKLINQTDLTGEEAESCIDEIMSGKTTPVATAAFLAALETKGETVTEITACAKAMRAHAAKIEYGGDLFEIVGTGGDRSGTFNISTTSALVIAAGGVKVAKHGNRAASSKSGAADCFEALGINIDLTPHECVTLLDKTGICFLFAQKFHTSMKYVAPVRKELGIRTVFNILGPLTNPAKASVQLLGVYSGKLVRPLAEVLKNLGVKRGMSVYGTDGEDEISASSPTLVTEFNQSGIWEYEISPEMFGLKSCPKSEIIGGTPKENAAITLEVLSGKKDGKRTAVLLNAGAGLYLSGKAESLRGGVETAAEIIDSGKALKKLTEFKELSNAFKVN